MVEFAPEDDVVQVNIKSSDVEVGDGGLSVEDAANLAALASAVDNGGGSNTNFLAVTVATGPTSFSIEDGADITQGTKDDVAVTAIQDTTPTTVVGILKGIFNKLYSIFGTGIPITSLPSPTGHEAIVFGGADYTPSQPLKSVYVGTAGVLIGTIGGQVVSYKAFAGNEIRGAFTKISKDSTAADMVARWLAE